MSDVQVRITGKETVSKASKDAERGLKTLDRDVKKAGANVRNYTSAAIAAAAAIAGIAKVVGALTDAYFEQEAAETKLSAALFATGNQIGITQVELQAYAREMSAMTGISDEAIISAQGLLTTFTKISGDTFPKALDAAADMSAMFGQDLQQSVIQLGTALNDPIAGIGRLRRIGISFTEEQKNTIASMVELNDIAGAQAVILDELNAEFGGVAVAMGETALGATQKLSNAFSDLQEQLGRMIATTGGPLITAVTDFFNQVTSEIRIELDTAEAITKTKELIQLTKQGFDPGAFAELKEVEQQWILIVEAQQKYVRESVVGKNELLTVLGLYIDQLAGVQGLIEGWEEQNRIFERNRDFQRQLLEGWALYDEVVGETTPKYLRQIAALQEQIDGLEQFKALLAVNGHLTEAEAALLDMQVGLLAQKIASLQEANTVQKEILDVTRGESDVNRDLLEQLAARRELWEQIKEEIQDTSSAVDSLNAAVSADDPITTLNHWNDALEKTQDLSEGAKEQFRQLFETEALNAFGETFDQVIGGAVTDSLMALGTALVNFEEGVEAWKSVFKNAISVMLQALAQLFFKLAVANLTNPGLAAAYAAAGAASLVAAGAVKALAQGGVIEEPVVGRGLRSGTTYLLGESGPEVVTPINQLQTPRRTTVVNQYIQGSILREREVYDNSVDFMEEELGNF